MKHRWVWTAVLFGTFNLLWFVYPSSTSLTARSTTSHSPSFSTRSTPPPASAETQHITSLSGSSLETSNNASLQTPKTLSLRLSNNDNTHQHSSLLHPRLDPSVPRRIVVVHVGKAGGNTIRAALPRLKCFRLRGEEHQAKCDRKYRKSKSLLVQAADRELHLQVLPSDIHNHTTFLWALRHPLTRVVSSYNFLHYNNTDSVYAQIHNAERDLFYKTCFPNLDQLLQTVEQALDLALASRTLNQCQALAVRVIRGDKVLDVKRSNVHLYYNHAFYYKRSSVKYPHIHELWAVRTEYLWEDLQQLDQQLGGPGKFQRQGKVLFQNKLTNTISNNATMTDELPEKTRRALCCLLSNELQLYQYLLQQARNLHATQKLDSILQLVDTCPFSKQYWSQVTGNVNWPTWTSTHCPVWKPKAPSPLFVLPILE